APDREAEAEAQLRVSGLDGPRQGGPVVVVVLADPFDHLGIPGQVWLGGLRQLHEMLGVEPAQPGALAVLLQPLERELPDRLEHQEPRFAMRRLLAANE